MKPKKARVKTSKAARRGRAARTAEASEQPILRRASKKQKAAPIQTPVEATVKRRSQSKAETGRKLAKAKRVRKKTSTAQPGGSATEPNVNALAAPREDTPKTRGGDVSSLRPDVQATETMVQSPPPGQPARKVAHASSIAGAEPSLGTPSHTSARPLKPAPPDPKQLEAKLGLKLPSILFEGDQPSGPVFSGPGRKFALGPSASSPTTQGEEGELPAAYGTGRMWLTARDPHCLCAQWDLSVEQHQNANRQSNHQHLVLRLFRDQAAGQPCKEIHVHPESRHWFIHVEQAGVRYAAELGCYHRNGQWQRLSVADPVATPAEAPAEVAPIQFATLPARNIAPVVEPVRTTEESFQPTRNPSAHRTAVATTLPAEAGAVFARTAGMQTPDVQPQPALSFQVQPPQLTPAGQIPSPTWTAAQEQALTELIGWSAVRQEWFGSEQIVQLLQGEQARQVPVELASLAAAQLELPSSVSAVPEQAPSSQAGGEQPGPEFWFNVNAELVIYGATEPDALVTIGGRPIRLRPDGTFSYRFSLPDGKYELPVVATAAHGDRRQARLAFARHTEYSGEVGVHPQDARLKPPRVENVS